MITIAFVLLAAMMISGCASPTPSATPTPAPTAAPTAAATPTQAAVVATPTPAPTAAPTPTLPPTPTPYQWGNWTVNIPQNVVKLTITGMVSETLTLKLDDLKGYPSHFATWSSTDGKKTFNGTGAYVLDLLNKAGISAGATNVKFESTIPPAFNSTVALSVLQSGSNATSIIAYSWIYNNNGTITSDTDGKLQFIMPGGGGKNQVQNIDRITVS